MESSVTSHKEAQLDILLEKVYRDSGYDFRDYKRSTVVRRLGRRLMANGVSTYLDYMRFLDAHPEEYDRFAEYLTIKVSGFFRHPYAYKQLARLVLPELVASKRRRGDLNLRFWSTACARGEEPYSLAIMLDEFLGNRRSDFDIAIYATDVSRETLQEVQAGRYSPADLAGIPDRIRRTYFVHHDHCYQVREDIRQMVKLFCFDLTTEMHRGELKLDCIMCCNVLIYFQRQLQERVLDMLYDVLAVPGYLVLGEVETLSGNLREKMECVDGRAKIYKKVRLDQVRSPGEAP